jgi:hypothetical protein
MGRSVCENKLKEMMWDFDAAMSDFTDRTKKDDAAC